MIRDYILIELGKRDWKIGKLARLAKVPNSNVYRWLKHGKPCTSKTIEACLLALDIELLDYIPYRD